MENYPLERLRVPIAGSALEFLSPVHEQHAVYNHDCSRISIAAYHSSIVLRGVHEIVAHCASLTNLFHRGRAHFS